MKPSVGQQAAISRLFSAAVFREMAKYGSSPLFARLIKAAGLKDLTSDTATVGDGFDAAFSLLRKEGCRDEYVYRAAVTHKVLLGKHSLNTASMLTEFRVGSCKADLAILNGTSTAYEIKSERDSLVRLESQIRSYCRFFAATNVIASEAHIQDILKTVPAEVGVMCLNRRSRITTVREAVNAPEKISPESIFQSLRLEEANVILNKLGVVIPDVPNTRRFAVLKAIFADLDPVEVHDAMVATLRHTRSLSMLRTLVDCLPSSLHAAALSMRVPRKEHQSLVSAVQTPLRAALLWDEGYVSSVLSRQTV